MKTKTSAKAPVKKPKAAPAPVVTKKPGKKAKA